MATVPNVPTVPAASAVPTAGAGLIGRRGRPLAVLLGVLAIALAVLVVTVVPPPEQDTEALYTSAWQVVRDVGLLAYLLATIAAVELARRRSTVGAVAARLVQGGYGLIAIGVIAGFVLQDDPDWFFVLAGPGLLASAAGFVTWAVQARRRRLLPLWAALLLGIGGVTAIAGAELGTGVLIGSFWLYQAFGTEREGALIGGVGTGR